MPTDASEEAYSGVLGAFPYAFRASDSWLFRSYVVVGGLTAAALSLLFAFALVVLVANTLGGTGGTFTFSRSFVVLVGLLVVAPVLAPVLLVARRRRRRDSTRRYDAAFAAAGYLFIASLYVGTVVSIPDCFVIDGRTVCPTARPGPFQSVVATLYALPDLAGLLPPLAVASAMVALHLLARNE